MASTLCLTCGGPIVYDGSVRWKYCSDTCSPHAPGTPPHAYIFKKDYCDVCGGNKSLHLHHVDGNRRNNHEDNFATLCCSCHRKVHQSVGPINRRKVRRMFGNIARKERKQRRKLMSTVAHKKGTPTSIAPSALFIAMITHDPWPVLGWHRQ